MLQNESDVELECRKNGLDIVEYPLYRACQILYMLLSLAAVPQLLYALIKFIFGSTFHRNIKILLLMYYSLALLHTLAFSSGQIFAISSLLVKKACYFFPPTYIYASVHLALAASRFGLILSLGAICCERIVATSRSRMYESNGIALGLFLVVLVIAGVVVTICYVYKIEDFDEKVLSVSTVPPDAVVKFNQVAFLSIVISLACLVTFYALSRINKKQCSVSCATLTARYQTLENVITTEFAMHIATLQVSFFIFYLTSGIIVRVFAKQLFHSDTKLYMSFRLVVYMVPIFIFVLPIYSVRRLKNYHLQRDNNIRSIVAIESRGIAGARNYDEIIAKSWQLNKQP